MAEKKVTFSRTFISCYDRLPKEIKNKVNKQIKMLCNNPDYPSLRVHKIKGTRNIWELRIDRKYRLTFEKIFEGYFFRVVGPHEIINKEDKK